MNKDSADNYTLIAVDFFYSPKCKKPRKLSKVKSSEKIAVIVQYLIFGCSEFDM